MRLVWLLEIFYRHLKIVIATQARHTYCSQDTMDPNHLDEAFIFEHLTRSIHTCIKCIHVDNSTF